MDIAFFNKWLHLLSIIGMLGGLGFAWLVLVPATKSGEEVSETVRGMWKRFGIALGVLWLVVLATGIYNMLLVSPRVNEDYQKFLGMKMGMAMVMFVLSLLIAHPMPLLARFFRNRSPWLVLLLILGVAVVGISAHLNISRVNGSGLKKAPAVSNLPLKALPIAGN